MSVSLRDLANLADRIAPEDTAEEWDNVGLQVGDSRAAIRRALVALEPSEDVVAEAERLGCQAIVSHHPLIFRPVRRATADSRVGRTLMRLIRSRIGLVVAHTNLDKSPAGPNHALAGALDVRVEDWLLPAPQRDRVKLAIFTPVGYERAIIDAIAGAGGGVIGRYSHCSFRSPGTGTFKPLEGARPFQGEPGRFEEADETRLEAVVPRQCLAEALRAALAAHPYEEPAYDVYPLEPGKAEAGLGIVGRLKRPAVLGRLRKRIETLVRPMLPEAARPGWDGARSGGDARRRIERVAICSGSGGSCVEAASRAGADCLITGEIGYHDSVEARSIGLAVVALGHFASEALAMGHFAKCLAREAALLRGTKTSAAAIEFQVAQSETDPMGGA